jgi:hypothetical protein
MTNQNTLFTGELDDNEEVDSNAPAELNPEDFIGEGKQWADTKILIKSKVEADKTIKRREAELAALRSELEKRLSVEEQVTRLAKQSPVKEVASNPSDTNNSGEQNKNSAQPSLTVEDVEKLLSKKEEEVRRKTNLQTTQQKLQELYGAEWQTIAIRRAKELGEPLEYFEELAQTRPSVLFNLLGAPKEPPQKIPSLFNERGINTTGQALSGPSNSGERTMSWYEELRKKDLKKYWTPAIQNQLHSDALKLGEKFFDLSK